MPVAHSRNMLICQELFPLEPGPQLLQGKSLQIGLGGVRRPHRGNLDAGDAVDCGDLHRIADGNELEIDRVLFAGFGHESGGLRRLEKGLDQEFDLFGLLVRKHVAGAGHHFCSPIAQARLEVGGVAR
jgi:hypothetical protein